MLNLDYICVKYGQEITNSVGKADEKKIKELKNNLRKAIGVLQEDGVYAIFLWFEKNDKQTRKILTKLLNEPEIRKPLLNNDKKFNEGFNEFCKDLQEIAENIDKLLFVKKLFERTLTYALYHAKIKEGGGNEQ
jgi:hypothetical protein